VRVIAYGLYGADARYTVGVLRNAQLAPLVYPGWKVRVYLELTRNPDPNPSPDPDPYPDPNLPLTRFASTSTAACPPLSSANLSGSARSSC
jgi:hypothetical protein